MVIYQGLPFFHSSFPESECPEHIPLLVHEGGAQQLQGVNTLLSANQVTLSCTVLWSVRVIKGQLGSVGPSGSISRSKIALSSSRASIRYCRQPGHVLSYTVIWSVRVSHSVRVNKVNKGYQGQSGSIRVNQGQSGQSESGSP